VNPFTFMHRAVDGLQHLPGVRQARHARFRQQFLHDPCARLFDGVYPTFASAMQAVPRESNNSYDNAEAIEPYVRRRDVEEYDYQPLFWIVESFREGLRSIADIGGSVAIKYYAFSRYTQFPPDAKWRVVDVPAAVKRGRALALELGASPGLTFTDSFADVDGCDVLLCLGSLQFLPLSLADLVRSLTRRPHRIIVNTTPIHEERDFFTLHSMGTGICPYRVVSRKTFLDGLSDLGYRVRHQWRNLNKDMRLPFQHGYDIDHFSGFCFDRASDVESK
jgi:putative methyltransferase (TIGR04325 family)